MRGVRFLKIAALALVFAALTQVVLHSWEFSPDERFVRRLEIGEFWAFALMIAALLWLRCRTITSRIFDCPNFHRALVAGLIGLCAPYSTPHFTYVTHPLLSIFWAWLLVPWLERLVKTARHFGRFFLEHTIHRLAWVIGAAASSFYFVQSYRRHLWFGSGGKDLGLFHQTHWLLSRFEVPHNTVLGMHAFGDHLELIDLLAAPLQWAWPDAGALLLFQAVLLGSSVVPVILLAHKKTQSVFASVVFGLCYIFAFDLQSAVMFDWNPTTCGIAFIAWALWFYEQNRQISFVVCMAGLVLAKENLILYGIGLCWALLMVAPAERRRLLFSVSGALALVFVLEMAWIFPFFRPEGFRHLQYGQLGDSFIEIAKNVVLSPHRAWALLWTPERKIDGLLLPFSSTLFLPFVAARYGFLAAPMIAERFWSTHGARWWGFHYGAGLAVYSVLAALEGYVLLQNDERTKNRQRLILWALLLNTALVTTAGRLGAGELWSLRKSYYTTTEDRLNAQAAVDFVPKNVSVAAQNHLLAHLAARHEIYEIHKPIRAEFVALDFAQSAWPYPKDYSKKLAVELFQSGYGVVFCAGEAVVLKKGASSITCDTFSGF